MEGFSMEDFEVVQEKGTTWEPKQVKDEDGDVKKLKANDKSWVAGYYMGSDNNVGTNNSTIHKFKLLRQPDGKAVIGDERHLKGDPSETGDQISIWGTGVLDGKIAEHVAPGQAVMVKWLGRKKPVKNPSGKPYHIWEVAVNHKITPLELGVSAAAGDAFEDFQDDSDGLMEPKAETKAAAAGFDDFEEEDF